MDRRFYPLFADMNGRCVVVVGGGQVAERKVHALRECGAAVVVVSPEVTDALDRLAQAGQIACQLRCYRHGDLEGAWLVIAATGDTAVNRQVWTEANQRRIFCNVVDVPEMCSFIVPAVVRRGALEIAISTRGVSPALAKRIRQTLEKEFGPAYETLLAALENLREAVRQKYPGDQKKRAEILEGFVNSPALELLQQGRQREFEEILSEWRGK